MFKDEFNITPSFIFHASFSMQICLVPLYYTDIQSGHVCSTLLLGSMSWWPLYVYRFLYIFPFWQEFAWRNAIAVNSLRLDWEYPSLSRIDMYDLNFTDISWTFYVLYMHYGLKIDMPSTCQIVGVWYLLSKISITIGTNSSDVL